MMHVVTLKGEEVFQISKIKISECFLKRLMQKKDVPDVEEYLSSEAK
jgi:hypothetical protein